VPQKPKPLNPEEAQKPLNLKDLQERFRGTPTPDFEKKIEKISKVGPLDIPTYERIPHDETMELIRRYQHEQDQKALDILMTHNAGLVLKSMGKFEGKTFLLKEDLFQEGNIGLMKGIEKFNLEKYGHLQLSTYVFPWIRQAMMRSSQEKGRVIRLPVPVQECLYKIMKFLDKCQDYKPTPEKIATETGLKPKQVKVAEEILARHVVSLTTSEDEAPIEVEDKGARAKFGQLDIHSSLALLKQRLGRLDQRERKMVLLRFGFVIDPLTGEELPLISDKARLREVGKVFGLTRERVRQIIARAIRKMRYPSKDVTP